MKIEGNKNPSDSINFSCDSVVKSITSDLTLLGNALMTRINDPLTILEFISFDSLRKQDLKNRLKDLIDSFTSCDSDDKRLKFLLEIHYHLAYDEMGNQQNLKKVFETLQNIVQAAQNHKGIELKKAVSAFQVEVLQVVPGISSSDYQELAQDIKALEDIEDINTAINAVYEKINMHTQVPFDE